MSPETQSCSLCDIALNLILLQHVILALTGVGGDCLFVESRWER